MSAPPTGENVFFAYSGAIFELSQRGLLYLRNPSPIKPQHGLSFLNRYVNATPV